jgi:mannitol-specific phosphotransferase system IIBC component
LSFIAAGYFIQPLNQSVIFSKHTGIILTNDAWRVAIDLDSSQYKEIISALKGDLLLVESQKKEFTPVSELHQVESLLDTLEFKLSDFYQILPKLDSRRGLINLGGTILKTLFGTATVTDINLLHETIDKLKSNNADISHSLTDQITYIKKLDAANKINSNAIANLSDIVKKWCNTISLSFSAINERYYVDEHYFLCSK